MTSIANTYVASAAFAERARLSEETFARMYEDSIANPNAFWARHGRRLDWIKPFTKVQETSFAEDLRIRWFEDGVLNASVNCLDRHLPARGDKPALIWEGDEPGDSKVITFREAHGAVCRFANILKDLGVRKGDRVVIHLPMIVEAAYAMLACARLGAIHSVVFAGFSPEALAGRIADCAGQVVITADEGRRAGRSVPLKANVDEAIALSGEGVEAVVVVAHTGAPVEMTDGRDHWLHERWETVSDHCPPEPMGAEDPLFILYTSGSTGKPKGVVHSTGGYLVWAAMTHEYAFDLKDDDVFWCTADLGWITGHTYLLYGPLANGTTTLMFEGTPTYPDASRVWQVCDRHAVTVFYTAPTAIRALMREGSAAVAATSRRSLRLLGSVGEPINPEAWRWYYEVVGESRCPIVDTWWQTETGGCVIAPLPNTGPMKPGAAGRPLFGIEAAIVDAKGNALDGQAEGNLVLTKSWPGQMRSIWGDHGRFFETYFATYPGAYFTGDGARRDAEGAYWITGRVDDVINVAGHRLGTAEVESALLAHPAVAEAAVVGCAHEIKGQGIYAYVTLRADVQASDPLKAELIRQVRADIGAIATPDVIQWTAALPKTRSGKIMRRLLRNIAEGCVTDLGDATTLADAGVIGELISAAARLRAKAGRPT
jgi:acetyl-CoA synthetase